MAELISSAEITEAIQIKTINHSSGEIPKRRLKRTTKKATNKWTFIFRPLAP